MCSAEPLREFIRDRLTAAAEEIFTRLEKTIVQYEEEIHRQRRLLELSWRPRSGSQRAEPEADRPPDPKKETVLCDWEIPQPAPPQGEEEQKRSDEEEVRTEPEPEPESETTWVGTAGKLFWCDVCGRSFKQRYEMKSHRRSHTGERPFCCQVCSKSFQRSSGLAVHMRIHTGHKPYSCRFCGRSFTQLSSLNYHRRTHADFQLQEERSSSLDREEPEPQPEPPGMKEEEEELSVSPDGEQLVLKQEAQIVMVTLADDGGGPEPNTGQLLAQDSAAAEDQNQNWDRSSQEHPGPVPDGPAQSRPDRARQSPAGSERSVRCEVCGKAYRHNYELKAHRRVHTGERPFPCRTCGKGFMRSSALAVHMRIHTGQRPYCCGTCGKTFTQLNSLNYHRGTHSDFQLQEERSSSLDQEEPEPRPEPPGMKEEEEELSVSPDGEQLVLKQEAQIVMVTLADDGGGTRTEHG